MAQYWTYEYGIQYDKMPTDVVLGRETNPDGSITHTMWFGPGSAALQRAIHVADSPAPIGGYNKKVVRRQVGPIEEVF